VRGHKDLRLLLAVSVLCALGALLVPVDVVRLVFAVPLTLFLPGYAIAAAAFAQNPAGRPKMALMGVGLSLALLPLGALVLNYVPGGIQAGSWALLLVLVVLAACRAAAVRRPRAAAQSPAPPRVRPSAATAAVLGLAALMVVAALVLAFITLPAKNAVGYTELWIQPSGAAVRVGVRSDEQQRNDYRLVVRGSGGGPVVRRFALEPGEGHVLRIATGVSAVAASRPVTAVLYRSGHGAKAYRRVSTRIPAPQATQ
jgi:Protein of unknown function (DUF1616)